MDFEQAAIGAARSTFTGAQIKGCLFHFSQAIWRKVQNIGLAPIYEDGDVKKLVKSLGALAFVRFEDLPDAWIAIAEDAPAPDHPA